jgi:nickel transport protein
MKYLLFMVFLGNFVFAHKLNVFLYQENDRIFLSAYFASGSVCKECKVFIEDENNKLLQEGFTNKKGEFIITKFTSYINARVDAGSGHMVEQSLHLNKKVTAPVVPVNKETNASSLRLEELKKENARLKSELALLQEKSNFSDVVRMIVALLIVVLIFGLLKRIKR